MSQSGELPCSEWLLSLATQTTGKNCKDYTLHSFSKGASGRYLYRLTHPDLDSCIGVVWTKERADNHSFVPVARCLRDYGVRVPEVIAYQEFTQPSYPIEGGMALIQDLGDVDLLSLKKIPWEQRRNYYFRSLECLYALKQIPESACDWQAPFDADLYRWEQEYFAQHYLHQYCGVEDIEAFLAHPEMKNLIQELSALPRTLVHRDFHSENILIFQEEPYFIDFQGMRFGRAEYDVASLIYDPYACLSSAEQDELFIYWQKLVGEDVFSAEIFDQCALQRLMQALGAYANIGLNRGQKWYLEQIPQALTNISKVIARTKLADLPWFKLHSNPH